MIIVFLINTIIGCFIFAVTSVVSSVLFSILSSNIPGAGTFMFLPILFSSVIFFYLFFIFLSIASCRIILLFVKTRIGIFPNTSKLQLLRITADVLTAHLCYPLYPSMPFLPILFGAKTGKNFTVTGKIFNADLLEAGDNVLIGEEAFLCGHLQQGNKMILGKIIIGNDVTLGVRSFIMPDVIVGDRSILAAYSVVPMGTRIPKDEIWAGNPAKKIKNRED